MVGNELLAAKLSIYVDGEETLYYAFHWLVDFGGDEPADDMILLQAEGRHRTIFISKSALDYVSIPTHKYEAGGVEAAAEALDMIDELPGVREKGK